MENSSQIVSGVAMNTIPESLISRVSEFSNGAFILISLDSQGEPVIHEKVDNKVSELAIESHARMYLKQRKILRQEAMTAKALQGLDFGELG